LARSGRDGYPPAGTRVETFARAQLSPAHKFLQGDTRPSRRLPKVTLIASFVLLAALAGCGESEGVEEGATVSVYVAAPLCPEAERELARDGGRAGGVRVRAVCLPSFESSQKLDLAQIGANARRATEDSTTIGYIGEPTRAATRFSAPILESAGIAQLSESSGAIAMRKLLRAADEAGDGGSLRQSVNDTLE
jgi:hypothetical protein